MGHRQVIRNIVAAALAVGLAGSTVTAGSATQVVVLLPGQTLSATGISGSPTPQRQRDRFVVRVVAVDASFHRDYGYSGPLVGLSTGESVPAPGLRFATSVSGAGAATSIPPGGGALRLSLNGEDYREYLIGAAATGDAVCAAIEAAIAAGNAGRDLDLGCIHDAASSRYTMFMNDGMPIRSGLRQTYPANSLTIDPAFGLAPALHLGEPVPPSSDPDDASEFTARRLVADPASDLVFDRGIAVYSIGWNTLADLGPNRTLTLDQGPTGLPVLATPFEVLASEFKVVAATALGDGQGRIHRVRLAYSLRIDPASIGSASDFSLDDATGGSIPGTSITSEDDDLHGYAATGIEVTFGTGLGRTDVTNVEVKYHPPAGGGIQSADTSAALLPTFPPLVDGAAPVLVSYFGQDIDSNGGLDRLKFFFSEPVDFAAGRGVSKSGFEPATDTIPAALPLPASLVLAIDGEARLLSLAHPDDPGASAIPGGKLVADAIAIAVQSARNRPAYVHFTCEFTDGRYVLRAGIPLRSVGVLPSPLGDDAAPLLRLGPVNGGIERLGSGVAAGDIEDFVVLSQFLGQSLVEGQGPSALHLSSAGDELNVDLIEVEAIGPAAPTFLWEDNGDLAFLADRAPVPNRATPANNVGLPPGFHPSKLIRIRDADSAPDDGTITKSPGNVTLDASQTIAPLLASNEPSDLRFQWTQIEGPQAVTLDDSDTNQAHSQLLRAGTYVFQLTVTVLDDGAPPAFNPYVHADGTLGVSQPVVIEAGPPVRYVLLLPGESLEQGVASHAEAIHGAAGIGTPGVPYPVQLVCSDASFNVVACPAGVTASLVTSDPDDFDPIAELLNPGGRSFTLVPATPGSWTVDDSIFGANETEDVPRSYAVGTAWNATAAKLEGAPGSVRLSWTPDPRPVTWNVYIGSLPLADLDHDGLPDAAYGSCATGQDSDPTDTTFNDLTIPPPGGGRFYVGTMALDGQETSPGVTSAGLVRVVAAPCP